jgi:hypothetical protein
VVLAGQNRGLAADPPGQGRYAGLDPREGHLGGRSRVHLRHQPPPPARRGRGLHPGREAALRLGGCDRGPWPGRAATRRSRRTCGSRTLRVVFAAFHRGHVSREEGRPGLGCGIHSPRGSASDRPRPHGVVRPDRAGSIKDAATPPAVGSQTKRTRGSTARHRRPAWARSRVRGRIAPPATPPPPTPARRWCSDRLWPESHALLDEPGVVENQHPGPVAKLLNDMAAHLVADPVGIPARPPQPLSSQSGAPSPARAATGSAVLALQPQPARPHTPARPAPAAPSARTGPPPARSRSDSATARSTTTGRRIALADQLLLQY